VERSLAAEHVLSEGETRIVALAAFLADISGLEHRSPFIFDDPVSSLDQDFEEKVVKRLVELSKTRQVIVFTHRLSLVALIESEVNKLKEEAVLARTPPTVALHIQSVCSFGKSAGVVHDINIRDLKPKQALNRMHLEQVPQLRRLYDAGDVAGYEARANGLCSDLRILVERCVEGILLNDVLIRFRRSVQTQGRISALAKITIDDGALINDLMTRYSVFEHSQSDELPAARPDIDEIEADVAKLTAWVESFTKRAVA
jgi:ABC-type multidrug transport system ATPase subunit